MSFRTAIAVIDIQERLVKAMADYDAALANMRVLLQAAMNLELPILLTEQYPKGLGLTVPEIRELLPEAEYPAIAKTAFSCFGEPAFVDALGSLDCERLILIGMETHVCVQQTAFDAIKRGYQVSLACDACCSRFPTRMERGLQLMLARNVEVSTVESLVFSLILDASHPNFREVSKLFR